MSESGDVWSGRSRLRQVARYARYVAFGTTAIVIQQVLAAFGFATLRYLATFYPRLGLGPATLTDWKFWFFWNDYWIFLKYLSWPTMYGDTWALQANMVALVAVAVGWFALAWRGREVQLGGDDE